MKNKTTKLVNLSLFIAIALTLSYFERFIPITITIPGVKLGLANVVTLVALSLYGVKDSFIILSLRILMSAFFYGGFGPMMYSFVGGLFALATMAFLWRFKDKYISLIGISVLGAIAHNVGQVTVAFLIIKSAGIFSYLSVLLVSAIVTGVIVGIVAERVIKYLTIYQR